MISDFEDEVFEAYSGEIMMILRVRKNMTKTELAKKVGVSATEITRYEKGLCKIPPHMYCRLADALGVHVNMIMDLYDAQGMEHIIDVWERKDDDEE